MGADNFIEMFHFWSHKERKGNIEAAAAVIAAPERV